MTPAEVTTLLAKHGLEWETPTEWDSTNWPIAKSSFIATFGNHMVYSRTRIMHWLGY